MKKSLRGTAILSIFVIVAVMFNSCDILDSLKSNSTSDNESLEEQIIGKWTYKTETSKKSVYLISSFEFRKDGSVSFSVDTTEAEGVITDINYEISGTTLTLIYLDGTTTEVYEDVSVFGNVLYIMGDDKPFIKENTSELKATENTNNPDIIPKSTTEAKTVEPLKENDSTDSFKLYEPKEYGVIDYGALFGVKEKVLSTDNLKYYGYFDVNKDSLILYNTALILNGFTGGFDDEFFKYSSIDDILYNDNIVSYKKEYGDKEIKVFLQRTLSSDFMIMFSLGEPYVDPKTQIEFSDFELYLDNIGEYGFQNYGLTFNIKNNSDSELIISGLTIRTYSERDGKKYYTTGSISLNDITLKVGNNEIKIPDKTKEQWQWRYVMGFDKSANINLEEYKVELNDYYSVNTK